MAGQQRLWDGEEPPVPEDVVRLREQVARRRDAWTQIRREYPIGSPEEQQYWDAYWDTAAQLWAHTRRPR